VSLLGDSDELVRAEAATVIGGMRFTTATAVLERMVTQDASALVRKNAAWALGKIGAASSRGALTAAISDKSGLVRLTAKAALASIK
jgi:HEAT repeat protein